MFSTLVDGKSFASFSREIFCKEQESREARRNQKANNNNKMSIKAANNNKKYFILIYISKILLVLSFLFDNGGQQQPHQLKSISMVHCQKVTHSNNNYQQKSINIPIPIPINSIQSKQSSSLARNSNVNLYSSNPEQQQHNFHNVSSLAALANRPLERPSLSLVSTATSSGSGSSSSSLVDKNNNNNGNNSTLLMPNLQVEDLVESPADWLMMEGHDLLLPEESKSFASFASDSKSSTRRSGSSGGGGVKRKNKNSNNHNNSNSSKSIFDDDSIGDSSASSSDQSNEVLDDPEEGSASMAGTSKEPDCASHGRYYCTYKEEYPLKLVTEVTKYYKWPLEKLFRDLHAQIMPKLAHDSTGNLVCDSITRVVRPGWARNTNERWLVVINTENYHQYVTEVVCQYGSNSRCNFIPPCYYSSCQQRYNTQKLLVIDPSNPYRGPFLSEFLFPSCCVCYVPSASDTFQDKYRSSPATIYQRTMQQESANNLYPPQFKPAGILEDIPASLVSQQTDHQSSSSRISSSSSQQGGVISSGSGQKDSSLPQALPLQSQNQAPGPGEIRRRAGELHHRQQQLQGIGYNGGADMDGFPRIGPSDSVAVNSPQSGSGSVSSASQQ